MTIHHQIHVVGPRKAVSSILFGHFPLDFNTIIPMPDELREYWEGISDYDVAIRHILNREYYVLEERFPGISNCDSLAELVKFLRDSGESNLAEMVEREEYLAKTYGFSDNIEWAWANWGSGRNAEQGILDIASFISSWDSWLKARFNTEDFPAFGAIRKLSEMYPDVHIHLSYLDIDRPMANRVAYLNGEAYSVESCNVARMARTVFSIDVPRRCGVTL